MGITPLKLYPEAGTLATFCRHSWAVLYLVADADRACIHKTRKLLAARSHHILIGLRNDFMLWTRLSLDFATL